MHQIKAVIFDLDGTIANTLPLCIRAFRQSVEPLIGRPVSDEEIIAHFGPSEEGTIMALAPGFYEQGIAAYLAFYTSLHDMCPTAFDGIRPLLNTLRNKAVRLAMVTGKGQHSTNISLEKFDLLGFFECIETGDVAGPRKAAGIEAVLKSLNLPRNEVIYVGDAPSDISASRQAGIQVVAAAWAVTADSEKLRVMLPDHLFYSVDAFARWLYTRI